MANQGPAFGPNPFGESGNPYQTPQPSHGPRVGGELTAEDARRRVQWPAYCLMILAPLGMLLLVVDFVYRIVNMQAGVIPDFGGADPAAPGVKEGYLIGQVLGFAFDVLGFFLQFLVVYGAYQMTQLRSRPLAVAANVISVIPCLSACCVLGIPFGIWGLVVLNDPAVKRHFT